jgi:hypothetical protein
MKALVLLFTATLAGAAPQSQAAAGGLSATPAYIRFDAPGGTAPAAQTIAIPASAATAWSASAAAPWLGIAPASGTGPGTISLTVKPTGMLPGLYSAVVGITAGGAQIASVPVTLAISVATGAPVMSGNNWYAAPDGVYTGDGSLAHPWDIETAFDNAPHAVKPGDTIWLRGGKYGDGTAGAILTYGLVGTAAAPILVRAYPGERAIIDAWLQVGCCDQAPDPTRGAYVWFWGLEFASYNPDRTSGTSGPPEWAAQANHAALDSWATGTKVINCFVHDTAGGISLWDEAPSSEAYGNIVYNVGGYATDRGHGHGFYMQNEGPGYKHVVDNITFNNFGEGLQMYGTDTAGVQNFHLEGNVSMNNGSLGLGNNTTSGTVSAGARDDNIIIAAGNGGPAGIVLIGNYTYHTPLADDGYNDLSYNSTPVANDLTAIGNYFIGGGEAVELFRWNSVVFQNNTTYAVAHDNVSLFWAPNQSPATYNWDHNRYFGAGHFTTYNGCVTFSCSNGRTLPFGTWQAENGIDANSSFSPGPPTGVWTAVHPNLYEPGRANIVIYNWDLLPTVQVDLGAAGVSPGDTFEIRDGENWFGPAVVSGTYNGGTVAIPMTGLQVALPNGVVPNPQPHTAPQFGVFVVLSGNSNASSRAGGRRTGVHRPVSRSRP